MEICFLQRQSQRFGFFIFIYINVAGFLFSYLFSLLFLLLQNGNLQHFLLEKMVFLFFFFYPSSFSMAEYIAKDKNKNKLLPFYVSPSTFSFSSSSAHSRRSWHLVVVNLRHPFFSPFHYGMPVRRAHLINASFKRTDYVARIGLY